MPEENKVCGYWKVTDNGRRARIMRQDAVADMITERIVEYFFHEGITYSKFRQLDFFPFDPSVSPLLTRVFESKGIIGKRDKVAMYCPPGEGLLFKIGIGEYQEKPNEEEFNKGWFVWEIYSIFPDLINTGKIKIPGNKSLIFSRKLKTDNQKYGEFQKV